MNEAYEGGGEAEINLHRGSAAEREASARDCWPLNQLDYLAGRELPRAGGVVRPRSVDELAALARAAATAGQRLVPLGAGSGVCGAVRAGGDDVVLDMKALRGIRILPEHGIVRAGAGVMGRHLEDALNKAGYTAGHFPSSIACSSVGGWLAARGAGQLSSRYGKIEDICVGATAVTPAGEVVRARKGDRALAEWIGSEGTLVAIAEAELSIRPIRKGWTVRGFEAPDLSTALELARDLTRARPVPSVMRVYDALDTRIALGGSKSKHSSVGASTARLTRYSLALPRLTRWAVDRSLKDCLVIVGWEGDGPLQAEALKSAMSHASALGVKDLGAGPGERWLKKRHDVSFKQMEVIHQGMFADTFEVACPWTMVETVYRAVVRGVSESAVGMAHFSHAYSEGCAIYFSFGGWAGDYQDTWRRAMDAANDAGATLTHHHGVGRLKAGWLPLELGGLHPVLESCKRRWDPDGRFNVGGLGLGGEQEDPASPSAGGPARAPKPHDWPMGVDARNGLWTGPPDQRLGSVEKEARRAGWTLGVSPEEATRVRDWLMADQVTAAGTAVGSARDHLVAASGLLEDGTPFGSRVTPRTAAGPWLLHAVLEDGLAIAMVTLRMARRPLKTARLRLEGPDALDRARALLVGDRQAWAVHADAGGASLWFPVETAADRAAVADLGAMAEQEPPSGLHGGRWTPWDELKPGDAVVGAGFSGGWRIDDGAEAGAEGGEHV